MSVVLVVIVGVILVVVAAATMDDGPQPATPGPSPDRGPVPDPSLPFGTGAWSPPSREPEPDREPEPEPDPEPDPEPEPEPDPEPEVDDGPIDQVGFGRRVRSSVLLVLTVAVLGTLAAGVLGGGVYLAAHLLDQALG